MSVADNVHRLPLTHESDDGRTMPGRRAMVSGEPKIFFNFDDIEALMAKVLLSSVIGKTVVLTKHGNKFVGLSPFTKEETPSFIVDDEKGEYHCLSSGLHGDVFSWLMRIEKLTFPQAVELLANRQHDSGNVT